MAVIVLSNKFLEDTRGLDKKEAQEIDSSLLGRLKKKC